MSDTKLEKLKSILTLVNEGLTKEDFLKAFGEVLKYVKEAKNMNEKEWGLVHESFQQLSDKHQKELDSHISDSRTQIKSHLEEHKTIISNRLAKVKDGVDGMDGSPGPKGDKGDPGKSATVDEQRIIEAILARIPRPKNGKDGRTVVGWGAHPLNIYQSSTLKAETARHLNFTGATVTQDVNGVTTIAISATGSSAYGEVVSGSGTTFTLAHTPTAGTVRLYANGQRLILTTDYTISGATITTVNSWSATAILADYSY